MYCSFGGGQAACARGYYKEGNTNFFERWVRRILGGEKKSCLRKKCIAPLEEVRQLVLEVVAKEVT